MRRIITFIAFLTLIAYALGLPLRLHEAEHERVAGTTCTNCAGASTEALWQHRLNLMFHVPEQPKLPPKQDCPICTELHATIVAPDAPIMLLTAAAATPHIDLIDTYQSQRTPAGTIPCRGPPAA